MQKKYLHSTWSQLQEVLSIFAKWGNIQRITHMPSPRKGHCYWSLWGSPSLARSQTPEPPSMVEAPTSITSGKKAQGPRSSQACECGSSFEGFPCPLTSFDRQRLGVQGYPGPCDQDPLLSGLLCCLLVSTRTGAVHDFWGTARLSRRWSVLGGSRLGDPREELYCL